MSTSKDNVVAAAQRLLDIADRVNGAGRISDDLLVHLVASLTGLIALDMVERYGLAESSHTDRTHDRLKGAM